ncbi:putative DNA repair protein, Swi5 [Septoria linicola]|nr:putative DNA repair protein, Swi5 [Septoria linicola]
MSSQELPSQQQQQLPPSSDAPLPSSPTPAKAPNASSESNMTAEQQPEPNPRLAALAAKHANLQAKLADLQAQRTAYIDAATLPSGLAMPEEWSEEQKSKQALATANGVIKEHILLLHDYNEIKDIGLGLMGLVADKRGVRQKVIMEDFGITDKD